MENPINEIDTYIMAQNPQIQPTLQKVRQTILGAVDGLLEKLAWNMPSYAKQSTPTKYVLCFAANKNHLGLYGFVQKDAFMDRLTQNNYKISKGSISIPYDKVDYELIRDIVVYSANHKE